MRVLLYGGSGFIGGYVAAALARHGHDVTTRPAGRLTTSARSAAVLISEGRRAAETIDMPAGPFDAVVNAAGLAKPDTALDDTLVGANALWPAALAMAAWNHGVPRVVHISSAGVHGHAPELDERAAPQPASPYGFSKLLGEQAVRQLAVELGLQLVVYRPTSVQGKGRRVTNQIVAIARSPLASVAGTGRAPTPQVLVENVAEAVAHLTASSRVPIEPVLHPWEGLTTASLLQTLGGRPPRHIPTPVARAVLATADVVGRATPRVAAYARRLEMLWFGQQQRPGWLDQSGYRPVRHWPELADAFEVDQAPGASPRMVYITQWYPPEPFQHPEWIVQGMRRRGWDVSVLTGVPNYPTGRVVDGYRSTQVRREELRGAHLLRSPLYPSHDHSSVGRILNYISWAVSASACGLGLLARSQAVYLYASPATAALPAMVARALVGRRFVLSVQDVWPDSVFASGFLHSGVIRRVAETTLTCFVNLSYSMADHVTVISPGMKDLLISRGVPAEKITVVWNWTDESVFTPAEPDAGFRHQLGLTEEDFCVFYAGNHGAAQKLETLIDAIASLPADERCHAVLVGDGVEKENLVDRAECLAPERIHFLDPRPVTDIPAMMAACDLSLVCLANDPLFRITMPSKMQSIMASGEPLLVCVPGDAANVVATAQAGVSAAPDNPDSLAQAILRARDAGSGERRRWGANGRRFYLEHMSEAVGTAVVDQLLRATLSRLQRAPSSSANYEPAARGRSVRPATGRTENQQGIG